MVRRRLTALAVVLVVLALAGMAIAAVVRRYWPGRVHTGSAAAHGATVIRYDLRSRFAHETLPQTAVTPAAGGRGRPLLVFLHGRGSNGNESNSNGAFYYWHAHYARYLRFYADALAAC